MKLKQSAYNYIYNDLGENQVVFYNSFTGALAVVKAEQYQQFKDYFENGKEFEDKEFYHKSLRTKNFTISCWRVAIFCRLMWMSAFWSKHD